MCPEITSEGSSTHYMAAILPQADYWVVEDAGQAVFL